MPPVPLCPPVTPRPCPHPNPQPLNTRRLPAPHRSTAQDCLVGLLFAFMPVLATAAGGSSEFDLPLLLTVMARVLVKLAVLAVGALVVARTVLPPAWRWLARRFGPESFQLASIAFCLLCALATARQGVSAELGAFVAGVMLSATEQQEAVLHHLGGCRAGPGGAPAPAALGCWGLVLRAAAGDSISRP